MFEISIGTPFYHYELDSEVYNEYWENESEVMLRDGLRYKINIIE